MRTYIAKILIDEKDLQLKTGELGEKIFKYWFEKQLSRRKKYSNKKQDRGLRRNRFC